MNSIAVLSLFLAVACAYPSADTAWDNVDFLPFIGIEKRIVGGEVAAPNQFPYQVRLQLTKRAAGGRLTSSLCGGSLISNKVVITAAHCVEGAISGIVHLGATNVRRPEATYVAVNVQAKDFVIHENWSRTQLINDIALIKLPVPVQLNAAIQTVNLPKTNQPNLDNQMGIISGFGRIGNIPGGSNELRFVARTILPAKDCEIYFRSNFKNTHVCVDGSQRKSACPGDSGGPLVITESNGSKTLVGLTSFGSISCEIGLPSVYTRITSYLSWISRHSGIPVNH